jgi:hypothetical protein
LSEIILIFCDETVFIENSKNWKKPCWFENVPTAIQNETKRMIKFNGKQ